MILSANSRNFDGNKICTHNSNTRDGIPRNKAISNHRDQVRQACTRRVYPQMEKIFG